MGWEALNMMSVNEPIQVVGLGIEEQGMLHELFKIYNNHHSANLQKNK